jgi:kynurenine---oxoglutarate transaminase / cysteine-S-conjugate beta-lyase / glutamine---phenylpyruvate transaminase
MDEKIKETMKDTNLFLHQYTRSLGHLRLVNSIAKCYSTLLNREINPLNEVLITIGAYGSLFNSFFSFIEKGDEVILIEPFFDVFLPQSLLAGAKCVFVPLKPKKSSSTTSSTSSADWSWDLNELEAAFNSKTKLIVLNTPNNPLGKVFTKQELEQVALLCIKYNTLCISDEVYEHITYDKPHLRIG